MGTGSILDSRLIRALPAAEQPTTVMKHVGLKYTKGAPAHPP